MTAPNELRLLPWSGLDDKPCYLSTDDPGSYMSRLANNIEAIQLDTATERLEEASGLLDDQNAELNDLRRLNHDLTGALKDVLRVAASRGQNLKTQRHNGTTALTDNRLPDYAGRGTRTGFRGLLPVGHFFWVDQMRPRVYL